MRYLITINSSQENYKASDVHNTITKLSGITDWWHYLPNTYIVETLRSVNEQTIADNIIAKHPGLLFLVVEVNLTAHNGVLPKAAWEWITRKTKGLLRVKPAPQPPQSANDMLSFLARGTVTKPNAPLTLSDILRKYK